MTCRRYLSSPADPDYLVLPKCGSSALIGLVGNLLREAGKTAQIIALIESAKGVGALDEIVRAATPSQPPCSSGRRTWLRILGRRLRGSRCFG